MNDVSYITIPLSIVAMIGTFLIAKKNKAGWLLWEIECGGLFLVNCIRGDIGECLLWGFYFIFNIYGYSLWNKEK